MKKIGLVFFSVLTLLVPNALPQESRLVVIAESAAIYAEPDSSSYLIETVSRGTFLTLFQKGKIRKNWYYIAFDSQQRKGRVSGFIHDSKVAFSSPIQDNTGVVERAEERIGKSILLVSKKTPLPLSNKGEAMAEKRSEELTLTAVSQQGNVSFFLREKQKGLTVKASPTKEDVNFQEIDRPPVMIKPREIKLASASSMMDERAFREVAMAFVALEQGKKLTVNPSSSMERMCFPSRVVSEQKGSPSRSAASSSALGVGKTSVTSQDEAGLKIEPRKILAPEASPSKEPEVMRLRKPSPVPLREELSITSFSGDQKRSEIIDRMLFLFPLIEDSPVFQEIIRPPLDARERRLPALDPLPEMKDSVFSQIQHPRLSFRSESESVRRIQTRKKVEAGWEAVRERPSRELRSRKKMPEPILVVGEPERREFKRLTLGLGYGQSLGGAGGFIQLNTRAGISFHGGLGYYPTTYIYSGCDWVKDVALFSGGIKFYLPLGADPLRFYLDLQYGGIGVEAAQIIQGIWHYSFVFDYKQKTLWGPSFLAGLEMKLGALGINGALGIAYNITKLDWDIQDYFLTFDVGLLFYF